MNHSTPTAEALTVARTNARHIAADRRRHRLGRRGTGEPGARDVPRESRITHVYRTLGRGLTAEYGPG